MNNEMLLRNIAVVHNFVSEDDTRTLLHFCTSFQDWDNRHDRVPDVYEQLDLGTHYSSDVLNALIPQLQTYYHPLIAKYQSACEKYAQQFYGRSFVTYHNMHLRKYSTGDDFAPHYDSEAMVAGKPDYLPNYSAYELVPVGLIEVAVNIYLNDDYEGGELVFPELDIVFKPKPGQLIMFPGGHEYKHGVSKITSGQRYTMASFLTTPKLLMLHAAAYNGAHNE